MNISKMLNIKTNLTKKAAVISTFVASIVSFSASATMPIFDYARVIETTPIYKKVQHIKPHKQCYSTKRHNYRRQHSASYDSATPEIFGAVIGGAIGNAIGHNKSNKKVGTIVGAVLGASIAHDVEQQNNRHYNNSKRHHQHCKYVDKVYNVENRLKGYEVTYKYRGEIFQTFTKKHPGKRLRIALTVSPAEY